MRLNRQGLGYTIEFDEGSAPAAEFLAARLDKLRAGENSPGTAISLGLKPDLTGALSFQIAGKPGAIVFIGTSLAALFQAIVHYLREYCAWGCFWGGERIDELGFIPIPRGAYVQRNLLRHILYFNPCTFGYSTVWWDERRWLKEFDWMIAHGVTMPLAPMGQEYIWTKVWKHFGIDDLSDYFTGPAFLPWHRMGCVNKIAGPLPNEWIEFERKRQHFFLEQARKMGMTPVLLGFAGFVPPTLQKLYPQSRFTTCQWCGFEPTMKIDPEDPLALEIARVYMRELINEYGTDHYYLADAFTEMVPPRDRPAEDYAFAAGKAIYQGMTQVDPEAVWVLQSWQFLVKSFWQPDVVEAYFRSVPIDKILIIDIGSDTSLIDQWRSFRGYNGRPWLWTLMLNGGGIPTLHGDIDDTTRNWYEAKLSYGSSSLVGAGFTMEGIENNPLFFELTADLFCDRYHGSLDKWLQDYCRRRYGENGQLMHPALSALLEEVYGSKYGFFKNNWAYFNVYQHIPLIAEGDTIEPGIPLIAEQQEPDGKALKRNMNWADMQTYRGRDFTASLLRAVQLALSAADALREQPLYILDLVDITRQCIGEYFDRVFVKFIDARDQGDLPAIERLRNLMLELLQLQIEVLSTHEQYQLGPWIRGAEKIAHSESAKELYRFNAKDQILRWGSTVLYDYAKKDWAELLRDVYLPRMRLFFDETISAVKERRDFREKEYFKSVNKLEIEWEQSDTPILEKPVGDPIAVSSKAAQYLKALDLRA